MPDARANCPDRKGERLFEADVIVARDRVVLRLDRHADGACVLERRLVRWDGVMLTQVLPVEDGSSLLEFVAADPYGEHLRVQYAALVRLYGEQPACAPAPVPQLREPIDAIVRLHTAANEAALTKMMQHAVWMLGGRSYIYRWIRVAERKGPIAGQRCLIGCHPGWLHAYFSQQWYRKDPLLEYALDRDTPILASDLEVPGDEHRARDVAAQYGFRSVVICPAHCPNGNVIGLLQMGNTLSRPQGEHVLWDERRRVLMQALAREMLNWHINAVRHEESERINLDLRECTVLRLLRAGRTASNVADSLDVSVRTVYDIFQKINRKFGVSHISRAVAMATDMGLLD